MYIDIEQENVDKMLQRTEPVNLFLLICLN